ncbi:hypothetical protein IFR05_001976 [Cadophora sp. M221]|nr:hypothetical protein IFR05_001976 [Cadophora sp. M221]
MASNDTMETEVSETFDSSPGQEVQTPPTPGQVEQRDESKDPIFPLPGKSQRLVDQAPLNLTTELETLKIKISELEKKARGSSGNAEDPADQNSQPAALDPDSEQYKAMERFLYQHRKEWELDSRESKIFGMHLNVKSRPLADESRRMHGPWNYQWMPYTIPEYKRPNPFDGPHLTTDVPDDTDEMDEFDHVIEFGGVRDRLRKNFEWEMDRIFLAEEMGIRRRQRTQEKMHEDAKKAQEAEKAMADEQSARPTCAQLKLNQVDWFVFRRLAMIEERDSCVIDILVGEPIINEDAGTRGYGRSGRRVRKAQKPPAQSPQAGLLAAGLAPLPERIRIHSASLRKILATIIGEEASSVSDMGYPSVVLVRPFKALFFAEEALRSWCTSLEEKFEQINRDREHPSAETSSLKEGDDKDEEKDDNKKSDDKQKDVDQDEVVAQNKVVAPEEIVAQENDPSEATKDVSLPLSEGGLGNNTEANSSRLRENDVENEDEEDGEEIEDPNDVSRSQMALDHLKFLLDFMDTTISAKQAHLNNPKCKRVSFSDLWYLFRPGEVVIGRDGKQAYRVINVTSSRHRVVPSWQSWFWNSGDKKKKAPFSTTCVYIDFDGTNLGPVSKEFEFKRFDGEIEVNSLPIYPLRFHPVRKAEFNDTDWKELEKMPPEERYRKKLVSRGTKFLDVVGIKAMYYAGPTLGIRDDVESQVVVDFETAFAVDDEKQQEWKPKLEVLLGNPTPEDTDDVDEEDTPCNAACCNEFVHNDSYIDLKAREAYVNGLLPKTGSQSEQPSVVIIPQPLGELRNGPGKNDYAISDEERMIMSYRVFGFVLRSRQWAQLDLSYLTELHPPKVFPKVDEEEKKTNDKKELPEDKSAFGRLVLEDGQKPMIQALIAQHFRDKESKTGQTEQVDIVKGKGKGLILLLHGAPGVGKTSTAEGVAELFRKPLFQITCGDLGSTAKEVEKALDINFTLANRWDCILLLDEADVFLAQRNKEDFKRNGLVAVFLRVLEYYAGVLFLTTNRVGDFDEAFTSRIHVSLYYPELSMEKTLQVFKINVNMINERFEDKQRTIHIDDVSAFALEHYTSHRRARWNGRQIRNACQTALALAEFEAQGNSHESVLKPNALVHLKVSHFQTVQKAYLEFAEYMNSLYGSTSSTRAKESKLRAIWVDENNNVVGTQSMGGAFKSKQDAFLFKSQGQPQQGFQHAPPQPQQVFQQHVPPQPQQSFQQQFPTVNQVVPDPGLQQFYQYQNLVSPQPMYAQASGQMQQQQYPSNQLWNSPGNSVVNVQPPEQTRAPPPPTTPPPPQNHQGSPAWLGHNIQAMYSAGSPQSSEQRLPNTQSTIGGGGYVVGSFVPGQQ